MTPDRRDAFQRELRQSALENLTGIYVHGETQISRASAQMAEDLRNASLTFTREPMRRMLAEMQRQSGTWVDQVTEVGAERLLSSVEDPQERSAIQREALTAAISYWEQKLAEPDIRMTDFTTGRIRLTRLRQRLDGLNGDQ